MEDHALNVLMDVQGVIVQIVLHAKISIIWIL